MRLLVIAALAASVLAGGAFAPSARAEDAPPAKAAASPSDQYEALKAEFDKARKEFSDAYRAASEEERPKLLEKQPKAEDWIPKFQAIADANPKDPAAAKALVWIVRSGKVEAQGPALDKLIANHIADPSLGDVAPSLASSPADNAEKFLKAVIEKNPDHGVQGQASYALAKMYARQSDLAARMKDDPKLRADVEKFYGKSFTDRMAGYDSGKASKEAEALLDSVSTKFGDVKAGRSTLGEQAKNDLFELRTLGIGKTAPEITGADVDGKAMKLSDYRGKVVVLDFFGFW